MEQVVYFLVVAGLFFLMMRFGCGAHVMGHGHGHREDRGATPPENEVDPVCHMTVRIADAKSSMYQGRAYYFCSPDCRQKFEANPASYIKPTAESAQQKGHHHGC